jgi:hypothetical protein
VGAYLDYLEGLGPCPSLEGLSTSDRLETQELFEVMSAGRGVDPHGSTPSVEELLAGTELEALLPTPDSGSRRAEEQAQGVQGLGSAGADVLGWHTTRAEWIERTVRSADDRVVALVAEHPLVGPIVTATYLDFTALFFAVKAVEPPPVDVLRGLIGQLFGAEPNLDYIGIVAGDSPDLLTQVASCGDLGPTMVVPAQQATPLWPAVLPLAAAFRRVMELAAPLWEPFIFDATGVEPLQLQSVSERIAASIVATQCTRPFRGDKGRAYKSFETSSDEFRKMTQELGRPGVTADDANEALDRLLQAVT